MENVTMNPAQTHADWLLLELERECIRFLELRNRLAHDDLDEAEREHLEGDLYAQLTQLESAAEVAREGLDAVSDALPDDDA